MPGDFRLGSSRSSPYSPTKKTKVTYWRESDGKYLEFLNDYPDHRTQGVDLDDLRMHLRDLFELFGNESIQGIRKEEELEIA